MCSRPLLFDIRAYRIRDKRLRTTDPRGHYIGTIKAILMPGLAGHYVPAANGSLGEIVIPNPAALRKALPYAWRRAWDRQPALWWLKDAKPGEAVASQTLRDRRGNELAWLRVTVATPTKVEG